MFSAGHLRSVSGLHVTGGSRDCNTPLNVYETPKTAVDRSRSAHNETGCSHLATRSETC